MKTNEIFSYLDENEKNANVIKGILDLSCPGYTCTIQDSGDVYINIQEKYLQNIGMIAHECFHAVEYIMEYVGIPHSNESSEAYAYF